MNCSFAERKISMRPGMKTSGMIANPPTVKITSVRSARAANVAGLEDTSGDLPPENGAGVYRYARSGLVRRSGGVVSIRHERRANETGAQAAADQRRGSGADGGRAWSIPSRRRGAGDP